MKIFRSTLMPTTSFCHSNATPVTCVRRSQIDKPINAIERSAFMPINSSVSWLGTVVSPLCDFHSSHLQQLIPICGFKSLIHQIKAFSFLKCHGTVTHYRSPTSTNGTKLVAFADASHSGDSSHLCYLIGVIFGNVTEGNLFHLIACALHKSRQPVKSIPTAEILAASEAIDKLIPIRMALSQLLEIQVKPSTLIDVKHLFHSLTSLRIYFDPSIRSDINCIRFFFEA